MKHTFYSVLIILSVAFFMPVYSLFGQVGIGTVTPEGALDLETTTQGLVYPRVALTKTTVEAPVKNPNGSVLVAGTVVYNTNKTRSGSNDVYPGIYVWDGDNWQSQFYMEEYQKYEQTGGDQRTTIRESLAPNPDPNKADAINGLSGKTFTPKYSGYYKIEVNTNFGAGQVKNFVIYDAISLSTSEGAFFFSLAGDGVDIDPKSAQYDYKEGWIYTHSYSSHNSTYAIDDDKVAHYVSVTYYKYLKYDKPYTFTLSNCMVIGSESFLGDGDSGSGQGHIGHEIPCSVEFSYVGTDDPIAPSN